MSGYHRVAPIHWYWTALELENPVYLTLSPARVPASLYQPAHSTTYIADSTYPEIRRLKSFFDSWSPVNTTLWKLWTNHAPASGCWTPTFCRNATANTWLQPSWCAPPFHELIPCSCSFNSGAESVTINHGPRFDLLIHDLWCLKKHLTDNHLNLIVCHSLTANYARLY